jgi:hypothetical protein
MLHLLLFSERQVSHVGSQNSRQVGQSKNRLIDDDECLYDIYSKSKFQLINLEYH